MAMASMVSTGIMAMARSMATGMAMVMGEIRSEFVSSPVYEFVSLKLKNS